MAQVAKIFPGVDKDQFILDIQWRGCWWSGDPRIQSINIHDIDLFAMQHLTPDGLKIIANTYRLLSTMVANCLTPIQC